MQTDQNLQEYESYEIMRYFDQVAPGRNGGGWVDTFDIRYVDRYSEQLWLTVFGKAREMTLFNYGALLEAAPPGDRPWKDAASSVNWDKMVERAKGKLDLCERRRRCARSGEAVCRPTGNADRDCELSPGARDRGRLLA